MGEFALGQPVSRFEDPRLLRGGGRYVDDMVLPRMAFGHVLRSPHAHARIGSIGVTAAKAAPGVLAVLTGADWEASGWGDLPSPSGLRLRDGSPSFRPRFPALVKDRVRWVGDYVAFVVALTKDQAADAAELIAVDYEPLPAIVSTADAVTPGAPLVWEGSPGNVAFFHPEGDAAATDAAFAEARHVVKRRFVINRVTAAAMEPRGAIADYNPAEDRWTIYTTLQRTHGYRAELARQVLKVPESRVRVVAGDIGGSFGMKSAIYNEVVQRLCRQSRDPGGRLPHSGSTCRGDRGLHQYQPGAGLSRQWPARGRLCDRAHGRRGRRRARHRRNRIAPAQHDPARGDAF